LFRITQSAISLLLPFSSIRMKKIFFLFVTSLMFTIPTFAQNEGISFQGLARNAAGEVMVSQTISLRLSILLGSESGEVAYTETRQTTTNPQGIFAVVVGDGTANSKTGNFSTIDWGTASKFIKVEMDPNGGLNFTAMGTSKLQPVPFAFYAYGVDAENVRGIVPVSSGGTGVASMAELKTTLGVDQVSNTSDASKPLSTASTTALASKVDKVSGKELSTNDYSTAEKTKLAAITGTNTGDQDLSAFASTVQLAGKVDKETGKGLSSNDYTSAEKSKLAAITGTNTGDQDLSGYATTVQLAGKVDKETGKGLSSNDYTTVEKTKLAAVTGTNTGDQDLSGYATTVQLAGKVDKETGKGLSTNDYSTAEKTKLAAITGTNTGDQVNITGNAATATTASTVTTNANLTGIVTSVGNATSIADGAITDAKITALAAAKITGTLPEANGGTGQTTFTDGQLLIGNSSGNTLTKATLTAGVGISVTNGNGTIAIANTGGLPATGNTPGDMLYWNGSAWVKVAAGSNGQTLSFYNGAPVWSTPNNPFANTVVSKTGKIWMDRNLGASQVATSSTDDASYGDLYQWGRGTDGHQIRTSATTATSSSTDQPGNVNFITSMSDWRSPKNDNLWQGVAGVNNPCPTGYRIPTETEWNAERLSWTGGNNATGAFASPLKLPMAGRRANSSGSLSSVGTDGYYWSATVFSTSSYNLVFSSSASMSFAGRASGNSVRCLKD
jgi:uncharacterized protein (TIGR02145 family)